jgi:hypothetical protein
MSDWMSKTDDYIFSVKHQPFEWGKHDCLRFADRIVECRTGKKIFEDWYGKHTTAYGCFYNYKKKLKQTGFKDLVDAIDSRLKRTNSTIANRYSIIGRRSEGGATGLYMGVSLGKWFAFVGYDGLEFVKPRGDDIEWLVS